MPYILSKEFGGQAYGRIYGTSFAFFNLGTLVGPLLMGYGFEILRSYTPVLSGLACLSCLSARLVYLLTPGRPVPAGDAETPLGQIQEVS